jgi:hypothetical protein
MLHVIASRLLAGKPAMGHRPADTARLNAIAPTRMGWRPLHRTGNAPGWRGGCQAAPAARQTGSGAGSIRTTASPRSLASAGMRSAGKLPHALDFSVHVRIPSPGNK